MGLAAQISQALDGKRSGDGYIVSCPAHGHTDNKSSCLVSNGNKQPLVAKCYAGCEWKEIEQGLIDKGLLEDRPQLSGTVVDIDEVLRNNKRQVKLPRTSPRKHTSNVPKGVYLTFGKDTGKKKLKEWYLYDEGLIARYEGAIDKDTGKPSKAFIPFFVKNDDGSYGKGGTDKIKERSLYNKSAAYNANEVWFVEGEKCVNALLKFGIVATTTSGGASALEKTSFNPLRGKRIVFWADNDPAGQKYQEACCEKLEALGCSIHIIDPEELDLEHKEDVCDFLSKNPNTTKRDLLKLSWDAPKQLGCVPDIDEELIPEDAGIRKFVKQISLAYNCEKCVPANILILSICGVIGSRAGLQIWQNQKWVSYPNTFGGLVAPPAYGKSPIMSSAMAPLVEFNKKIAKERAEEAIRRKVDAEMIDIEISELKSKLKEQAKGK